MIHEIYGLTDWEPTVADRLAKEGYVAILPDLLSSKHGKSPARRRFGRKLIGELEPDRITADLDAMYAYVNGLPAVDQGQRRARSASAGAAARASATPPTIPNLKAVVVCYGPPPDSAAIKQIKAPVLGIYGENDARITGSLPDVTAQMQSAGKTFTPEVFPGTGHGFLKPGRQGSDGPQVEKAWKRILEFYRAGSASDDTPNGCRSRSSLTGGRRRSSPLRPTRPPPRVIRRLTTTSRWCRAIPAPTCCSRSRRAGASDLHFPSS